MALAEEHSEDFRLDPLLNIHIHHNLSEILPLAAKFLDQCPLLEQQFPGSPEKVSMIHGIEKCDQYVYKRRKVNGKGNFVNDARNPLDSTSDFLENGLIGNRGCDNKPNASYSSLSDVSLKAACENMKQKYLSAFNSKLSHAQEEYRKSYMQVCNHPCYHLTLGVMYVAWCILLVLPTKKYSLHNIDALLHTTLKYFQFHADSSKIF